VFCCPGGSGAATLAALPLNPHAAPLPVSWSEMAAAAGVPGRGAAPPRGAANGGGGGGGAAQHGRRGGSGGGGGGRRR
jgi:hypothetical protein